jgi:hypothetical protein
MATNTPEGSALPDGLRYYLLRGSVMIPLVPIDQLPFQLQGIPRQLTHRQMSDESWKLLHETELPATTLSIQAPSSIVPHHPASSTKPRFLAPDHRVRTEPTNTFEEAPRPNRWSMPPPVPEKLSTYPSISHNVVSERPSSLTDSFALIYQKDAQRLGYRMPFPSGIEPDPSKKEFCSHWIKTGECAFTAQGCRYKHEMPAMGRLREIAITARGPTWMQRRLAPGNDNDEYAEDAPAPRVFPDPSTFRARESEERGQAPSGLHSRSILQKGTMPGQATTLPLSPPSAPTPEANVRRGSQISNLLIDLEDTPAPPPSPQPSNSSSASADPGSCDTQVRSSRSSVSPPASPTVPRVEVQAVKCTMPLEVVSTVEKRTPNERPNLSVTRRNSLTSWASDNEEATPMTDPLSKRKTAPRRPARRCNPPPVAQRQSGISKSKHATIADNDTTNKPTKNAEAHNKNACRRLPQRTGNQTVTSEMHSKFDHGSRKMHHKDRARKGAAVEPNAVPAAVKYIVA